jgi:predicted kinase
MKNENKPTQFILCGIPFSGKTTLGKKLEKRLGFVHINLDDIKKERGYGDISDDDVPNRIWKQIFAEADKRLIKALKSGRSVVNETAWVTRKWRDRVRKIAEKLGFPTKVIYIKIPEEIAKKRWQQNRLNKKRYDTKDDEFEGYIKDFEKPTPDEELIIYDYTIPIKDWIKKYFNQLN